MCTAMSYGLPKHGELVGIASATACPSVSAKFVKFKARATNTGYVCIGTSSNVTLGAGTTNATTGFELAAGEDTPWLPVAGGNLNSFYRICSSTSDHLTYITISD